MALPFALTAALSSVLAASTPQTTTESIRYGQMVRCSAAWHLTAAVALTEERTDDGGDAIVALTAYRELARLYGHGLGHDDTRIQSDMDEELQGFIQRLDRASHPDSRRLHDQVMQNELDICTTLSGVIAAEGDTSAQP